jgi:hypothetical protein
MEVEIPETPLEIPARILDKLQGKLGYSDAVDRVGTTAAPLLAGFALTLIGLTVTGDTSIRWPDAALATLVLAVLLLIGAVQASFNARSWYVPLTEFLVRLQATPDDQRHIVTGTYSQGLDNHKRWLTITRRAYNLGILFLLAGLVFVLVPKGGTSDARDGVIALAVVGFAVESAWLLRSISQGKDEAAKNP